MFVSICNQSFRADLELMTAAAHGVDRNADAQAEETLEELAEETASQVEPCPRPAALVRPPLLNDSSVTGLNWLCHNPW
jgi:hypothetical protein